MPIPATSIVDLAIALLRLATALTTAISNDIDIEDLDPGESAAKRREMLVAKAELELALEGFIPPEGE